VFFRSRVGCPNCNLNRRSLFKREKTFPDSRAALSYYDVLLKHLVDGPEFASLIRADAKSKDQEGAVFVETTLHRCSKCKAQMIEEKIRIHNGSEWKDADKLSRRMSIPYGVDLVSVFS
jgi:hypothetical protein